LNLNWDLNALYKSDEKLDIDLELAKTKAKNFEKMYKNGLKNLNSNEFIEAIREYENISQILGKIMTYAFLKFATNSDNGGFYAKYQNEYTNVSEFLLFFELEFNRLSKAKQVR